MRYVVTGGAGFIGSNTVDELVRRGHQVTVFDDLSAGKKQNLADVRDKIDFVEGTVTDARRDTSPLATRAPTLCSAPGGTNLGATLCERPRRHEPRQCRWHR